MNNIVYNTKTRIKICGIICLIPALLVACRLFYLQTFKHDEFSARTEKSIYAYLAEDRVRGNILDVNGNLMAESLRTHSCAVLKKYVNDKNKAVAVLSSVLGVSKKDILKKWSTKDNFFYVDKKIKPETYTRLTEEIRKNRLTGIELSPEYERIHPYEKMGIDLIGAANSKNLGLSGIEQLYNKELSQDIGKKRAVRARRGQIIYERGMKEETNVSDIYLTIDSLAQYHVEEILEKYVKENDAERGMAIVQNPKTGNIIAAASYPVKDGQSMAFQFTYEPGSTFKAITTASAIDSGTANKKDVLKFEEKDRWLVSSGFSVRDATAAHGNELSITKIMEVSSNRGVAKLAVELGPKDFFYYIKSFGFGTKTDVGFQGEARGTVRPYAKWTRVDTASAGYGYGISLTGIQLVNAYSAIANGGYLMQPHIINKMQDGRGKVVYKAKANRIRAVLKPQTSKDMTEILRSVVSVGTGKRAQVKGYTIAGKTGTAEKASGEGGYAKKSHIVSFCGFFPATDPEFTILFVLDQPAKPVFGGQSAAPAFAEIAKRLITIYAVVPDNPGDEK
ncbi:Peptidoglycan glycosyltransferase [Elusimicrobium minutum Pei191]|uniref:Peptidoglycan glycosyltransferase n=1 Tax=Elusimicrobium minutum (strain Pei191) TaxID=445932 RepID=B2KE58_ELUMP|nr:penicillin-binding protein 2 [Elusimicrobium minutum]ACC98804.1 Peptidoglycan glycosyltransferase [Elusimicrobium minutum Pei191]